MITVKDNNLLKTKKSEKRKVKKKIGKKNLKKKMLKKKSFEKGKLYHPSSS